jgi:hypothetical protein
MLEWERHLTQRQMRVTPVERGWYSGSTRREKASPVLAENGHPFESQAGCGPADRVAD